MPNWCNTSYVVTGNREQQKRLYNLMSELEKMPTSLLPNDFGSAWLCNLVERMGGDIEQDGGRGYWHCLEINDDTVSFETETAWCEQRAWRHFIEEMFNGLKIYYQSDECGMCEYYTNDPTGRYFPDKYILDNNEDGTEYYESIADLCRAVKEYTGREANDFKECEEAVEEYASQGGGYCGVFEYEFDDN